MEIWSKHIRLMNMGCTLVRIVRKYFFQELKFELKTKSWETISLAKFWGKNISGRVTFTCNTCKEGKRLVCPETWKNVVDTHSVPGRNW